MEIGKVISHLLQRPKNKTERSLSGEKSVNCTECYSQLGLFGGHLVCSLTKIAFAYDIQENNMIWRGIDINGTNEQTDKVILHSFYLLAFHLLKLNCR